APTATPTPAPTATPTPAPTATPTPAPTATPTPALVSGASYVAPTGNDANSGTASSPWATLQKAANSLPANGTVYVRAGTYTGFTMSRSGLSSTSPTSFLAYPGDPRPVIAANGRVDVIKFSANHDVVVRGFVIQGAAGGNGSGAGIRIENGAYRITIKNNLIQNNRSYGVNINNSTEVVIDGNEVTRNEEGIYVSRLGAGVRIVNNLVHHQDKMVVNTSGIANDDHGAVGIALVRTTGAIYVGSNQIWSNRAASYDYAWDGGAFEIYSASNVTMAYNVTWDNENVLETGSDGTLGCGNNVFRHNVSYGATSQGRSFGMFLRCAYNMTVANNVFHNLDQFVFSVKSGNGLWDGSIEGLRIQNNIAVMATGKIIGIESTLPASVSIDRNLFDNTSGGYLASVVGKGSTNSLATFTSWTGQMGTGIDANPMFTNPSVRDYHVQPGSPVIDRGVVLFGTSVPIIGSAPDIGRYDTAP
ncbi:MAG: right-handed parallel beta-helix repeat-containing protein, partial [Chloroflexi bacterium]|nr:right-handed parallel beta-helix repeat-containing protein [Chloroflexota bacterium]